MEDGDIIFCPRCGTPIKKEEAECSNCGQNISNLESLEGKEETEGFVETLTRDLEEPSGEKEMGLKEKKSSKKEIEDWGWDKTSDREKKTKEGVVEGILKDKDELVNFDEDEEGIAEELLDKIDQRELSKKKNPPPGGLVDRLLGGNEENAPPEEEVFPDEIGPQKKESIPDTEDGRTHEDDSERENENRSEIFRLPRHVYRKKYEGRIRMSKMGPVLISFLAPLFLMSYVGLEFILALLLYPTVNPATSLYYLTPTPYFKPFWISSLTLSFLIVLVLFISTWRAYDFNEKFGIKIDKQALLFSTAISFLIVISLVLYIYNTKYQISGLLTLFLIFLILIITIAQIELLRRDDLIYPEPLLMKKCIECGEPMKNEQEVCPECGTKIAVLDESLSRKIKSYIKDRDSRKKDNTDVDKTGDKTSNQMEDVEGIIESEK